MPASNPPSDPPSSIADARRAFLTPGKNARPRTFWFWINGNVSKEGITRDLEWMHRIGMGGVQLIDMGPLAKVLVPEPAPYLSSHWQSMLDFAAAEARRLDMEFGISVAPGSSPAAGPWVTPAQAMKRLVWSETALSGGRRIRTKLPAPPANTGPFQDMADANNAWLPAASGPATGYYADVRVLAYRTPEAARDRKPPVHMTTQRGPLTGGELLGDGRFDRSLLIKSEPDGAWIDQDFGSAVTIRSLRIAVEWPNKNEPTLPNGTISASDDGIHYRTIAQLPSAAQGAMLYPNFTLPNVTIAFPATTARHFRVTLKPNVGWQPPGTLVINVPPKPDYKLSELDFSPLARPNRFEAKAGFAYPLVDYRSAATAETERSASIRSGEVLDVSRFMKEDGSFDWVAPPGHWTILRLGHAMIGTKGITSAGFDTLEADKLSRAVMTDYIRTFYGKVTGKAAPAAPHRTIDAFLTDSWEVGQANWTPELIEDFKKRRHYDPTPYLPILADHVVDDARTSDRFLWDFRRTLADLLAENYYGVIGGFARDVGAQYYAEGPGVGRPTTADGLQVKQFASIPMSEYWVMADDGQVPSKEQQIADMREVTSAAHVFGQNIAAAEAFTSYPTIRPYSSTPRTLKRSADVMLASGINQFVIHASPHQPLENGPGLALGPFGQQFSRLETWAEMAKPWIGYLSRSSELLQAGKHVADVAYFYGEGAAVSVPFERNMAPALPPGYGVDFVNRDIILRELDVDNGWLVTRSGMRYAALILPAALPEMSVELLTRIEALVLKGATISVGAPPVGVPGLADDDQALRRLSNKIWQGIESDAPASKPYGRGRWYRGFSIEQILRQRGLSPDFEADGPAARSIRATHRRLADGDIYFVSNQSQSATSFDARFRSRAARVEIWNADDGSAQHAASRLDHDRTIVPMAMAPGEALFVIFRNDSAPLAPPPVALTQAERIMGGWSVRFEGEGAPVGNVPFPDLRSWTESADPRIRYFSGIATYEKKIRLPAGWSGRSSRIYLDLGEVRDIAEIFINGKPARTVWTSPYRVEIGSLLRSGSNVLTVRTANTWENRLIGEQQTDQGPRSFTTNAMVPTLLGKDAPLSPAGLLGPVQLLSD